MSTPLREPSAWRYRAGAGALILFAAVLRILFLLHDCPFDLAPDEGHYWDWSRHLDWSYYSKGPLVAYLIRGGCALAGDWARNLTGHETAAVRLPAILCSSLLLSALYILTVQVFRRETLALAVVGMALTLPVITAGASLMTIDAPYTCCWAWALVLTYHAACRGASWAWPTAGLVIGLGILAKYTMVLFLPSVGLFLLTSAEHRRLLLRPGFWVMSLIAGLCCLPILIWNMQNDWVTFHHVGGQAGADRVGVRWLGPLAFVGVQCALMLIWWFIAWVSAMWSHRPWRESDAGVRFLWWLSAPMFLFFLAFSLRTPEEPNWPVTCYISGLVLTAGWIFVQLQSPSKVWRNGTLVGLSASCLIGLTVCIVSHFTRPAVPLLARISGPPTDLQPMPLRRFDPTCRLRGWRTLAAEVDRLRDQLRLEGIDAVLTCSGWNLPGELGFYCKTQPTVYSLGAAVGDRMSQYDIWRPNPLDDKADFFGRTFIFVGGGVNDAMKAGFESTEPTRWIVHREAGQPIAAWPITICRGYRGLDRKIDGIRR
jgi:hypothetical protein